MPMNRVTSVLACAISLLGAACSKQPDPAAESQIDAHAVSANEVHACLGSMFPIHKANNGEKGEPYCIDSTLLNHDSYCLRNSTSDAIHVRSAASPEAFKTFANSGGDRTAATLGSPAYSTFCKLGEQPDVWKEGDHLRIEASGPDLKMSIAEPGTEKERWSIILEPDPSGGHFYFSGIRGDFIYFVMLTDYNLGKMGPDSPVGVQAIAHGYRVEIFKNDWGDTCAAHRPDFPKDYAANSSKSAPPPNFHRLAQHDSCISHDAKNERRQPVSGGGGHDYP